MHRRSVLTLLLGIAAASPKSADGQETEDFLRSKLATSDKPDGASMDEISARLAWVWSGKKLPPDVRDRTYKRAMSQKPDKIGPFGFREDVGPTKRCLCIAILSLDDKL